jgi:hypothetical protein
MHPVASIVLAAEARSRELIAEAAREKLAEQALAAPADADAPAGISKAQVMAFSLAVFMIIAFAILVANASSDIAVQYVATGP